MNTLKPNHQRAKNAITLIWIVMALEILSFVSGYMQYNLLQEAANGQQISNDAATANDGREQFIAIFYLITFIISGITFILWFRRAYYNLHTKVKFLELSEGWAAGSWFVPVLNLFRPYRIMNELYQETKDLFIKNNIQFNQSFSTKYVGWWWTLWIIHNLITQFISRVYKNTESIEHLSEQTFAFMMMNILAIPLSIITIKVIKDYSNVEHLLAEIKDDEDITN